MMKTLEDNNLGPNSRRITKRVLSTALSYAERNDLVARNAAKLSEKISVPKRKPLYIQPEQLSDLFVSMQGHRFEDLYYLYAHTGIRRGEGLGIKWSDVHMETTPPTVTIQRSWTQIGNNYEITSPKTEDSIRQVPITPELVQRLTKRKETAIQRQFEPNTTDLEDQYVFATIDGIPYRGDAVTKELAKIGNSAGIPNIGPHQLRHLHASMVLGQGIDIAVLSKHLGHTNIGTTVNIYTHQTSEMVNSVALSINTAIGLYQSK
jgi:integrase